MAIPNEPTLSTRMAVLKRSEGKSACRSSAYISGSFVHDRRTGEEHDYRYRKGVEHSELMLPEGAPEWARDRQELWNRAEAAEKRKDSQVARELRFAFSYDLSPEQRRELAREVAQRFTAEGMCADVAVHRYSQAWEVSNPRTAEMLAKWQAWDIPFVDAERSASLETEHVMVSLKKDGSIRDYRLFQPHCHILTTLRPFADPATGKDFEGKTEIKDKDGKVIEKSRARQWNDQSRQDALRDWIARRQNELLDANGSARRVDPRGYEVRREAELQQADVARSEGRMADVARAEWRAAALHRVPAPYLGVAQRVKSFTGHVRDRFSQWVAVRHGKRLKPLIDELYARDKVEFVTKAQTILRAARLSLGLEPEPERGIGVDR